VGWGGYNDRREQAQIPWVPFTAHPSNTGPAVGFGIFDNHRRCGSCAANSDAIDVRLADMSPNPQEQPELEGHVRQAVWRLSAGFSFLR
jgi:hypothetical protein